MLASDGFERLVFRDDGEVLFAVRHRLGRYDCFPMDVAFDANGAGLPIRIPPEKQPPQTAIVRQDYGDPVPRVLSIESWELASPDVDPQRASLSGSVLAMELVPSRRIGVLRGDSFRRVVPVEGTGIMQDPLVAGGEVFYQCFGEHRYIGIVEGATGTPYISDAGGDATMFHTDGEHIAWVVGRGRTALTTYETLELWVSPHTAEPASLEPRLLRTIGPGSLSVRGIRVGAGYVGIIDWDQPGEILNLIRISDGAVARIPPPESYLIHRRPLYISTDEVAIYVRRPETRGRGHIWKLRLDALNFDADSSDAG